MSKMVRGSPHPEVVKIMGDLDADALLQSPEGSENGGRTPEEERLCEPGDFVIRGSFGDAAVAGAKCNQGRRRANLGEDFQSGPIGFSRVGRGLHLEIGLQTVRFEVAVTGDVYHVPLLAAGAGKLSLEPGLGRLL